MPADVNEQGALIWPRVTVANGRPVPPDAYGPEPTYVKNVQTGRPWII
jgi:hypothetical protein